MSILENSSLARVFCGAVLFCAAANHVARAQQAQMSSQEQPATDESAAAPAPDKSGYSLLDPTPDSQLRSFAPDR
ncbi:MAG: hypothetical protein ABSD11_19065, partial [Methylocella sp.]